MLKSRVVARGARAAFTMVAFASASGCAHVAPYEREKLADPSMTSTDLSGAAEAHVRSVHEGATGGGALGESGCGCN